MVYNAMKLFMEINPRLFDDCSAEYTEHQNNASSREQSRQDKWAKLQEQANKRKNMTSSKTETDNLTQDSQKRLDALKLQDEASAGKDANSVRIFEVLYYPSLAFGHCTIVPLLLHPLRQVLS